MTQAVPLYVVIILLCGAGLLFLAQRYLSSAGRTVKALTSALETASERVDLLTKQIAAVEVIIRPAAEELTANMAGIPKLLEMVARVGQAQVEVAQTLRAEQVERQRNPFGRPNAPVPPRDVTAANLEHEIQEMMRSEGVNREEAMLRMNPANARSVWEGDEMMRGWR